MASFYNIEWTKSPFGHYRIGYANIGTVRIMDKSDAGYRVYMAPTPANEKLGLAHMYVGVFATLGDVSKSIRALQVRYRLGTKQIEVGPLDNAMPIAV